MSLNKGYEEISRGDENVIVRVFENCVQVFWTNESNLGDTARKTIKDEILNEFKGKLIVDFKREGQCLVMFDVITILIDDLDSEEFKVNIIEHHTRCREKTAEWKSENQVHLFYGLWETQIPNCRYAGIAGTNKTACDIIYQGVMPSPYKWDNK